MRALGAEWIHPLLSAVYQSQDTWAVLQERWAATGMSTVVVVVCRRALHRWQTAESRLVHVCVWRWCVSLHGAYAVWLLPTNSPFGASRFLRHLVLSAGFALGFLCPSSRRNRWVCDGICAFFVNGPLPLAA